MRPTDMDYIVNKHFPPTFVLTIHDRCNDSRKGRMAIISFLCASSLKVAT